MLDFPQRPVHDEPRRHCISARRASSLPRRSLWCCALVSTLCASGQVYAQTNEEDTAPKPDGKMLPGSPRPEGLGLAPDAPPVPPAPGGRAPSFGAPTNDNEWTLQLKGRLSGWQAIGIGSRPENAPEGYHGTPVHVPALVEGKQPFWSGAGFSLFSTYGNSVIQGTINFYARLTGKERDGFYNAQDGPSFGSAYLTVTPEPVGNLRVQWKVGAFTEAYGGPGQWGWGVYGPLLAVRGYGETLRGEYTVSNDLRLTFAHGLMSAPKFDEEFARGIYTGWTESGRSTFVNHGHVGFSYKNIYTMNFHAASAVGTDEREWLSITTDEEAAEENAPDPVTGFPPLDKTEPQLADDGRMDVYIVDSRLLADPYGEIGLSAAFWNFNDAFAVHDGIWWGIDWTQGGREMLNKFVGPASDGNGQLFALSAEYNLSIARLLWYPRTFDGRSPDLRTTIAGMRWWVVDTADSAFEGSSGYTLGTELEYQINSWFSARLRAYTEKRHTALGPWYASSVSPGLSFRRDWTSSDRIEIWYSRLFYNSRADENTARPLDRHIIAMGATFEF